MLSNTLAAVAASALIAIAQPSVAATQREFVFSSIDPPGSVTTVGEGINDAGDIVGAFVDARGTHGFILRQGEWTTIDYPGAAWTDIRAINAQGDIVGTYGQPGEPSWVLAPTSVFYHGYLLSKKGQFTPIHYPGHLYEIPQRITSTGLVVGCYHDMNFMPMNGFTLFRDGFTSFFVPQSMHNGATPDGSVMAGLYNDPTTGLPHGYVFDHGRFQTFDVPGSTLTAAWDINPQGEIVGQYRDGSGAIHGFLRDEEGNFSQLDFPGSRNTQARGINARGEIVGWYVDSVGMRHGFLARREDR